jgi:hypothetical protein
VSRPDATAQSALGQPAIRPAFVAWLDVLGDTLRATTWAYDLTFSGTGDPDLDGFSFTALDPQFVNVGPVKSARSGSDTVTVSLSGIIGPDSALLNLLGNPANWRGRTARLWQGIYSVDGVQQGGFWPYFTGTMSSMRLRGAKDAQAVDLQIETYLAILAPPSNRTYLDQKVYDPDDRASEVLLPIANGASGAGLGLAAAGSQAASLRGGGAADTRLDNMFVRPK